MKKILVLEDDETIRMGLCYILKAKGYEPVPAENIAAARELFHGCSLCLLDVMLPDGSGVDLCKEIRQCSNVPVIFLTCVDDSTRISRALDIGGDDYVIKPFDSAVLLSRINAALRRSGQTENSILDELELTAIERELLGYFRLNRGRVLTREQILSRLWDSRGEFVGDNTLSVRINRLRAKLEKAGTDGTVHFVYKGKAGQHIRLGGSFTNWDSWIYELTETSPGLYELELPLPAGKYYYSYYI